MPEINTAELQAKFKDTLQPQLRQLINWAPVEKSDELLQAICDVVKLDGETVYQADGEEATVEIVRARNLTDEIRLLPNCPYDEDQFDDKIKDIISDVMDDVVFIPLLDDPVTFDLTVSNNREVWDYLDKENLVHLVDDERVCTMVLSFDSAAAHNAAIDGLRDNLGSRAFPDGQWPNYINNDE